MRDLRTEMGPETPQERAKAPQERAKSADQWLLGLERASIWPEDVIKIQSVFNVAPRLPSMVPDSLRRHGASKTFQEPFMTPPVRPDNRQDAARSLQEAPSRTRRSHKLSFILFGRFEVFAFRVSFSSRGPLRSSLEALAGAPPGPERPKGGSRRGSGMPQ